MTSLQVGSATITDHNDMVTAAFDHFSDMLGTALERAITLDLHALHVPQFDLLGLDALFIDDEIWAAVKSLPIGKAPGPDGFTSEFLIAYWDTIKHDFREAFDKLYSMNGQCFQKLNEALLTLLPKRADARSLYDYRPISLIHSIAKLISKVLSLRLASVIHTLISPAQSTFLRTKCIHDSFLYVQNCIKALHRRKTPALLLKLDIAKAFDNVAWEYILELMEKRGFSARWRDWIALLLSSSSSSFLLNGIPGKKVRHRRGLRQGDPLS